MKRVSEAASDSQEHRARPRRKIVVEVSAPVVSVPPLPSSSALEDSRGAPSDLRTLETAKTKTLVSNHRMTLAIAPQSPSVLRSMDLDRRLSLSQAEVSGERDTRLYKRRLLACGFLAMIYFGTVASALISQQKLWSERGVIALGGPESHVIFPMLISLWYLGKTPPPFKCL